MKTNKLVPVVVVLCLVFGTPTRADEQESSKKHLTAEEMKSEETYQKQKSKIKELDGSEWDVTVYASDGKSKSSEEDKLVFQNGRVSLKGFEKKEFPPVGYTVTPDEKGEGASWENFQETKDGSLAMYGRWEKDVMTGSVRERDLKGKKSYTFSFTSSRKISLKSEEAKPVEAVEAALPQAGGALVSLEQAEKDPDQKS